MCAAFLLMAVTCAFFPQAAAIAAEDETASLVPSAPSPAMPASPLGIPESPSGSATAPGPSSPSQSASDTSPNATAVTVFQQPDEPGSAPALLVKILGILVTVLLAIAGLSTWRASRAVQEARREFKEAKEQYVMLMKNELVSFKQKADSQTVSVEKRCKETMERFESIRQEAQEKAEAQEAAAEETARRTHERFTEELAGMLQAWATCIPEVVARSARGEAAEAENLIQQTMNRLMLKSRLADLEFPNPRIRLAAVWALAERGDRSAIPRLQDIAEDENEDAPIRDAARQAIRRIEERMPE